MTAESLSAFLVNPYILDKHSPGYYRSKLYITSEATNPLLAAANPLFCLLERLNLVNRLPAICDFCQTIEHEFLAFRSYLNSKRYPDNLTAMGYYMLAATMDELIGKNYLRLYGLTEFKAFTPSSFTHPEELFFEMLDYIKDRPAQYLDLLELTYYCLISGFEGKYHYLPIGRQCLDTLLEELYQLIQQHRVYPLLNSAKIVHLASLFVTKTYKYSLVIGFVSTAVILLSGYLSYHLINSQAQSLKNHAFLSVTR